MQSKGMPFGSFKALFDTDRDTVAYRGNVCNQKGSPRVHWSMRRLNAKNEGP